MTAFQSVGRPWQVAVAVPVIAADWLILALAYIKVNHLGESEPNYAFLVFVGILTLVVWLAAVTTWRRSLRGHVALVLASAPIGGIPLAAMLVAVPFMLANGSFDWFLVMLTAWACSLLGSGLLLMRPAVRHWTEEQAPASQATPDGSTRELRS